MNKKIVWILLLMGSVCGIDAQKKEDFVLWEDSLVRLHSEIIAEKDLLLQHQKNEHLFYFLGEILEKKNSSSYPFQKFKTISVVSSKDKKVRLFTWYLIDEQGNHEHYGYLQTFHPLKEEYYVYPLIDKWRKIRSPGSVTLSVGNWYGAVYYELIENKSNTKTYYTLLGWNGGDIFVQHKVIEVLSFTSTGAPSFGATIFKGIPKGRPMRIIFDYAKTSNLMLRHQKQQYAQKTSKRDPKTRKLIYDTLAMEMIVFNRLIPMDESLEDIPQFMVSEASLNDAFYPEAGKWVFRADIIARNSSVSPPISAPKKRIHYQRVH